MSFPSPPPGYKHGYLNRHDLVTHHLHDTLWATSAVVLGLWCVVLGVWVTVLHRKAR